MPSVNITLRYEGQDHEITAEAMEFVVGATRGEMTSLLARAVERAQRIIDVDLPETRK